jgi:Tol biopolymer transport system component
MGHRPAAINRNFFKRVMKKFDLPNAFILPLVVGVLLIFLDQCINRSDAPPSTATPEAQMPSGVSENISSPTPQLTNTASVTLRCPNGMITFSAYVGGNFEVSLIPADGSGTPLPLHPNNAMDYFPQWSPGSDQIAFISEREGLPKLFTVDIDSPEKAPEALTGLNIENLQMVDWTAGGLIVFTAIQENAPLIYSYNPSTMKLEKLSLGEEFTEISHVALSPDGYTLAFAARQDNSDTQSDIYLFNMMTGKPEWQIGNSRDDLDPAWLDARTLIFASNRIMEQESDYELYRHQIDSNQADHPLTNNAWDDRFPAAAVNGQQIAFASDRAGNFDIYVADLSDVDQTAAQITSSPGEDLHPDWCS